ncbi:MAG TPA: TrkA family potassium uptake protein, partial [Armatimonadota bacterium]|nr:TrkA family potassium uptake protein [Armatimonadota bacterium]
MYIIVAGGGKVGYYLTKTLVAEGHEVLLIEQDVREVSRLSEELGEVVMHGDASEMRTMKEAGMERADVVVSVTGDDGDNLVITQLAKRKFGVPRTIARVNNPKNEQLFHRLGIDQTVVSTKIIFNLIEQQIETDQVIPIAAL